MNRRFLNGETWLSKPQSSYTEYIGIGREPPELKRLSRERKRKQHVILEVAASETGRAQTGVRALRGMDCNMAVLTIAEGSGKSRQRE